MDWLFLGLGLALIFGAVMWYFRGPDDPDGPDDMLRFGGGGGRGRR